MTFTFKPAVRRDVNLLIGLAGGTGSGKTYTAMRLAQGMAGDKPFVVIDTEAGRANHYADQFRFDHGDLRAPFTPDAYVEAIQAADDAGYPVIVVDSMSHEYAGEGGILDWQEEEFQRMGGRDSCVIDAEDWRKKEAKEQRDEARANGLTPILAVKYNTVKVMCRIARQFIDDSDIAGVMDGGRSEMTMVWQEENFWFRARPDWLNLDTRTMVHYKTTAASAEPGRFGRSMVPSMGYDTAMAFYRRGVAALKIPVDLHVILAQEQIAPYACSLVSLSPAAWAVADAKVDRAVALWKRALATGQWPAYSTRIHDVEPTPWAIAEAEAAMMGEQE